MWYLTFQWYTLILVDKIRFKFEPASSKKASVLHSIARHHLLVQELFASQFFVSQAHVIAIFIEIFAILVPHRRIEDCMLLIQIAIKIGLLIVKHHFILVI